MSNSKKYIEYKNKLTAHLVASKENKLYALKRLDIMIVALSSGGIYLGMELLKMPNEISSIFLLIVSPLIFSSAIISNIISQWTGYKANVYDSEWTEMEIEGCTSKKRKKYNRHVQNQLDCKITRYNKLTSFLNGISSLLLIIGIIYLGIIVLLLFRSWV